MFPQWLADTAHSRPIVPLPSAAPPSLFIRLLYWTRETVNRFRWDATSFSIGFDPADSAHICRTRLGRSHRAACGDGLVAGRVNPPYTNHADADLVHECRFGCNPSWGY